MHQVTEVLRALHRPQPMRPGMIWQLIYQDLKPSNLLLSDQDRVNVLDLGGCQLVNLETDLLAKYVQRQMETAG